MCKLALLGASCLAIAACTTTQTAHVESTVNALCQSAPLAQIAYNVAVQNHDNVTVNQILNIITASCPAVLTSIHTYQETQNPPAPPPPPSVGERG
jgi:hypothetical protein